MPMHKFCTWLVYYCFPFACLSPVPDIHWRRMGKEMPYNHEVRMAGAQLYLHNVQSDDSGTYRCEAVNSKGKDFHYANVSVQGKRCVLVSHSLDHCFGLIQSFMGHFVCVSSILCWSLGTFGYFECNILSVLVIIVINSWSPQIPLFSSLRATWLLLVTYSSVLPE